MSRFHAMELGPKIRVNCVAPGFEDPNWIPGIAMKRLADPKDIAHAVKYLADEAFVTGQTIDVNGGTFMR